MQIRFGPFQFAALVTAKSLRYSVLFRRSKAVVEFSFLIPTLARPGSPARAEALRAPRVPSSTGRRSTSNLHQLVSSLTEDRIGTLVLSQYCAARRMAASWVQGTLLHVTYRAMRDRFPKVAVGFRSCSEMALDPALAGGHRPLRPKTVVCLATGHLQGRYKIALLS